MTTDDRLVSGASSEPPNKSSGDIVERLCRHVSDRGGQFKDDDGNIVIPNGAWQMMIDAAAEIERLRREVESWTAKAEAAWRREDKQGADIIELSHRALTAESAVAAAMERERDSFQKYIDANEAHIEAVKLLSRVHKLGQTAGWRRMPTGMLFSATELATDIASAIRAAVSKKTAESGHSPSTHNSESE